MASPKKPYSELSRSAKYYRDNPKARAKKAQTDKKINARPEQRKKRSELSTARRKMKAAGVDLKGKDLHHGKGGKVKAVPMSTNRGNSTSTKGDRKARGRKKK